MNFFVIFKIIFVIGVKIPQNPLPVGVCAALKKLKKTLDMGIGL